MPFAKRGDVVHSEATSGFNNQKKSLLINGLAALGDSHHPLHGVPPADSCLWQGFDARQAGRLSSLNFPHRTRPHPKRCPPGSR